jgi:hypothetical protein
VIIKVSQCAARVILFSAMYSGLELLPVDSFKLLELLEYAVRRMPVGGPVPFSSRVSKVGLVQHLTKMMCTVRRVHVLRCT